MALLHQFLAHLLLMLAVVGRMETLMVAPEGLVAAAMLVME
jgi:hypothetical protein